MTEHVASATKEIRGDKHNVRYRGRCSCGKTTSLHYSTPDAAKSAMEHTHIAEINLNERTTA